MTNEADEARAIGVAPEALAELEGLFDDERASFNRFERDLGAMSERHGWSWLGERRVFHRRALALYRNEHYKPFCAKRRQELQDRQALYWILHNHTCERHAGLDTLTLKPDHPFWDIFFPPLSGNAAAE